jgi:hypothetical protein
MAEQLVTERLLLRPWRVDDADAALGIFGDGEVARWLSPAMDRVSDESAMRLVLQQWTAEDSRMIPPAGRQAASAIRWRPSDAISHRLLPPHVALVGFSVTVKSRSNDQEADHPSWVIGL